MDLSETEQEIMESLDEGYSNQEILEALREDGYSDERIQKMISDVKQKMEERDGREQGGGTVNSEELGKRSVNSGRESESYHEHSNSEMSGERMSQGSNNLKYATIGQRVLAKIADFLVAGVLYGMMFGITFVLPGSLQALSAIFTFVLGPFLPMIYFVGMEGRSGATVGKKLMSIKIVSPDGSPIGYKAALIRNLLAIVDSLPTLYLLGIYMIKSSDQNQRFGDKVADTVVVES